MAIEGSTRMLSLCALLVLCLLSCSAHANETPAPTSNVHPIPPSHSHHNASTLVPTLAPHHPHHHNHSEHNETIAPQPSNNASQAPTQSPTPDLPPVPEPDDPSSLLRILGKTIAWCIIIGLSILAFGACMSHRYRILFFCKGLWYTILRLDCTQYIIAKLRLSRRFDEYTASAAGQMDGGLNTIIFDSSNEMSEGLLMRETDE